MPQRWGQSHRERQNILNDSPEQNFSHFFKYAGMSEGFYGNGLSHNLLVPAGALENILSINRVCPEKSVNYF